MRAHVEFYGCSLSIWEGQAVKAFLKENGFTLSAAEDAEIIIMGACAVKEVTENRMLNRIARLYSQCSPRGCPLIVFGCLSRISPEKVKAISNDIALAGPSLSELAGLLSLSSKEFSPGGKTLRENRFVSIIPIAFGCLGECSFCCVRNARGRLESFKAQQIRKAFSAAVESPSEVWLTAQDTAAYGMDIGWSLPKLLKYLLGVEGDYRVRIGMMNPALLKDFLDEVLELFEDERLYRFLHIPVQSGSDRVLALMKRNYSAKDFVSLAREIRKRFPDMTLSTDAIVGFPGESEEDFRLTKNVLEQTQPDIVNISRYGARPDTFSASLGGQLPGGEKKERSRELSILCKEISLKRNSLLEGKRLKVFVSEKGKGSSLVGRSQSYKPVVLRGAVMGEFAGVKIVAAREHYLLGEKI